jgi:lysophospholipase L1-like esterase
LRVSSTVAVAFCCAWLASGIAAAATTTPLISRGVPAFASSEIYPAKWANDNDYATFWRGAVPSWIAYDLSAVPASNRTDVVLVWYNDPITGDYDHAIIGGPGYNNLGAYTVEVNAAAGGGAPPATGWVVLASVSGNTLHSRQHRLHFAGYNWLRVNVSASDGSVSNVDAAINLDVYDARSVLGDDWIFFGDSITAGSMSHETTPGHGTFSQMINAFAPAHFPLAEGGGIGYLTTTDGAHLVPGWLTIFLGKYVGLSYGTNDALGCVAPATFYNNYASMVQAVVRAGKVPLVPHIPWGPAANIQSCGPSLNAKIDNLYAAYPQIVRGPDLWAFFKAHPKLISGDQIHPTAAGMSALRQQWASTVLKSVYAKLHF